MAVSTNFSLFSFASTIFLTFSSILSLQKNSFAIHTKKTCCQIRTVFNIKLNNRVIINMGCCSSTKVSDTVKYLENSNEMTTQTESTVVSDNKESKTADAQDQGQDPMDLVYYKIDGSLRKYSYNLTRHQSRLESLMKKQIDNFYQRFNDGTFVIPILKQCSVINNNNYNIPPEITNLIASFVGMIKYKPPDIVFHLNTCAKAYRLPPVSMRSWEAQSADRDKKEYVKYLTHTTNILIPIEKLAMENKNKSENKDDNEVKNARLLVYEAQKTITTIDNKLFKNKHFSRLSHWYYGHQTECRLNPQIKIYFDQLNASKNNDNIHNNNNNNTNDNKENDNNYNNDNEIRNQINYLADECDKIDGEDRDQFSIDVFEWDHLKTVSNNDVDIEIKLSSEFFARDAQGDSTLLQALYLLNFENSIVNEQLCVEKPLRIEVNKFIQHEIDNGCFDSNCLVLISNDECDNHTIYNHDQDNGNIKKKN